MAILYCTEYTDKKFKILNFLIKKKFVLPRKKGLSTRAAIIQNILKVQNDILTNSQFSDEEKYNYLILLLKSIADKGSRNWFMVFGESTLNKKAEHILSAILLNSKEINQTVKKLEQKNAKHMNNLPKKTGIKIDNAFKNNAKDYLYDTCLHAALEDVVSKIKKLPNYLLYAEQYELIVVIERYNKSFSPKI